MTNFETLKDYVKGQLQKIVSLELEKNQKIADCRYTVIRGTRYEESGEVWAAKKRDIQDEYTARIQSIHTEIAAKLDAAQKAANQEYANAIPHPTADEYAEIQSLIYRYTHSEKPNKEREFIEQRDFNVENETRLARIYIFAGRDLGISKAKSENRLIMDQTIKAINMSTANITAVAEMEQDELLMKISPAMSTAQDHIDMVVEARRFYAIFELLALQEKAVLLTPENFRQAGTYSSWTEVRVTLISIKNRLFELGANPNMDMYAFINSDLQ